MSYSCDASCNYTPLGQTYCSSGIAGCGAKAPSVGLPSQSIQRVYMSPLFGAGPSNPKDLAVGWGYNSLTHGGVRSCTGYFDLKAAYPMSCPPIMDRKCASMPVQTPFSL
jgi:hypothetical protein